VSPEATRLTLHVVVASTRPGRIGLPIGAWALDRARAHAKFDARLVDLKEVGLPLFDEPKHPPGLRARPHEGVERDGQCCRRVRPRHAGVQFLDRPQPRERALVPRPRVGLQAGGVRQLRRDLGRPPRGPDDQADPDALKVMPIVEAVTLPFAGKQVEGGVFTPTSANDQAAAAMLDELHRWAGALRPLRG
jgi:hypothetical protein